MVTEDPQEQGKSSQTAREEKRHPTGNIQAFADPIRLRRIRQGQETPARRKRWNHACTPEKPFDEESLNRAVTVHGAAVNSGDNVQITKLEFREHMIIVDVNGGGPSEEKLARSYSIWHGRHDSHRHYNRQLRRTVRTQGPPGFQQGRGGTIYLQFAKNVPDLTPEELKSLLGALPRFYQGAVGFRAMV